MSLLSTQQIEQIRSETKKLYNTFFVHTVTLHKWIDSPRIFSEGDEQNTYNDIDLRVFVKWEDEAQRQTNRQGEGGKDISRGYMLIDQELLHELGLWVDERPEITMYRDEVTYRGERFMIIGVEPVAPLAEQWLIVKVQIGERL